MKKLLFAFVLATNLAFAQETKFRSEEVNYWNTADSVHIFGTLTMPESGTKFPAVLLITGSGTQDRDETILGHKPFKVIAEYLTNRGSAVLRVDDRGAGRTNLGKNPKAATSQNFAKDVLAGVDFLKNRPEINSRKIGLIGHSEGGMIAPMAANQSKDVAFIVSLAGTGVPGRIVTHNQTETMLQKMGMDSSSVKQYAAFNDKLVALIMQENDPAKLEEGAKNVVDGLTPEQKLKFGLSGKEELIVKQVKSQNIPWVKYFMKHDPAEDWAKVKCPVLAINGTKDTQVDADLHLPAIENALKKGGNKQYKIVKVEGLNHLFQHANTGLVTEYAQIKEDFAPEALQIIGDWLAGVVK